MIIAAVAPAGSVSRVMGGGRGGAGGIDFGVRGR
jgi:hypothetical protein